MRRHAAHSIFIAAGLCLSSLTLAASGDRPPGGSIAYVLTNMSWAMQSTPEATECPKGLNEGTREQFKQLFPDDGTKRSFVNTQLRREIESFHPTTAAEPFAYREGEGTVAPGMDLDGVAGTEDFTSPDGRSGIDNQMHRVLGCTANYRAPDGPIRFFEDEMVLRENYNRVVLQLTGVESLKDDDAVEVRIFRGRDKVLVDAGGLKAVPGGTQRMDLRWGENYIRETRGRISDGVLHTEPVDLLYPWDVFWLPSDQYMYKARLALNLGPTAASGLIGGYVDIPTWYLHTVKNWGTHYQSYGNSSLPSIYKAMRRLADAEADPQTGEKRAISGALAVLWTQVNVIPPDPAEYAAALERRRLGVPYVGMPAERTAEEESRIAAGDAHTGLVSR